MSSSTGAGSGRLSPPSTDPDQLGVGPVVGGVCSSVTTRYPDEKDPSRQPPPGKGETRLSD